MNSASRLVKVFAKAEQADTTKGFRTARAWGWALDLQTHEGDYDEDTVGAALAALRGEIELARTALIGLGCPPELFNRYLNVCKSVTSLGLIHTDWQSMRPS